MPQAVPIAQPGSTGTTMTITPRRPERLLATLLFPAVLLAGCSQGSPAGGAPPPPEVAVTTAEAGSLPMTLEYTGQTAGSRDVEVRARVSGILLQRRYQEGGAVRQGDVLFQIDPEPYRAAAAQARAEVGVERAKLNEARRQHDRILPLFDKGLVSQMNRDEAISNFEVAEANVAAAEAKLRKANLDLGYTEVRAPIAGLTSHEARSEGSLVTAGSDSSLLTRIVQTDPTYV
jgi:membrane fusion protein, multidrug efflux system